MVCTDRIRVQYVAILAQTLGKKMRVPLWDYKLGSCVFFVCARGGRKQLLNALSLSPAHLRRISPKHNFVNA